MIALTQPWPRFNAEVGPKSYWLLFSLNVVALVSVIFILPETKGISLERMDKIFGQIDAVEGGEQQEAKEIAEEESTALGRTARSDSDTEKIAEVTHVEASKHY